MTSDIESVFKHDENTTYYVLEPTPVSNQTGPTNAWKVQRVGLFYFDNSYGAQYLVTIIANKIIN